MTDLPTCGEPVRPVADVVAARAAATVARHARNDDDRRELLDALGLPDEDDDGGLAHVVNEGGGSVDNVDQGDVVEQDPRALGYRALVAAVLAADGLGIEGGGSGG
ncbi:hypothetical protein [Frankia sp. ACN1ag]|uniref:hypothetical protein n=1 Tax=Frankia sp. ACN1ag TaxID=102891 RepID=UPI0006DC240E|nr:hypothetical protein [Frankia sp. ACN1ag]KQC39249.1 hypothetical protein UK82_06305 [Frankia sp. ACN1ag]